MRFALGARHVAHRMVDRVAERFGRRYAVRLAGAAVAAGGLALMGFGTVASPLSSGALASPPTSGQAITNITVSCSSLVTTGTLSVSGAVTGDKVTLEVFAHKPGNGTWFATGATETITMAAGTTNYSYSISGVPAAFADGTVTGDDGNDSLDPDSPGDDYNAWRVQVSGTVGSFDGTTTKSASYECPGTTTSTSSTSSTTQSTTSSTSSSSTSSSSTSSTSSSTSTSSTSSESSSSTTSSTSSATAPESSTTSTSVSSSTAPASTSTASTPGTGVGAASTPSTGAGDGEFGIGLGLLIAGGGLVAGAARFGRRPRK